MFNSIKFLPQHSFRFLASTSVTMFKLFSPLVSYPILSYPILPYPILPYLPIHCFHITFFDSPVALLPACVTHLILGKHFNQPVNNLPHLVELRLPRSFQQPINNLPNTIQTLVTSIGHPIKHLPSSFTHLDLVNDDIQVICPLPPSLLQPTILHHSFGAFIT